MVSREFPPGPGCRSLSHLLSFTFRALAQRVSGTELIITISCRIKERGKPGKPFRGPEFHHPRNGGGRGDRLRPLRARESSENQPSRVAKSITKRQEEGSADFLDKPSRGAGMTKMSDARGNWPATDSGSQIRKKPPPSFKGFPRATGGVAGPGTSKGQQGGRVGSAGPGIPETTPWGRGNSA